LVDRQYIDPLRIGARAWAIAGVCFALAAVFTFIDSVRWWVTLLVGLAVLNMAQYWHFLASKPDEPETAAQEGRRLRDELYGLIVLADLTMLTHAQMAVDPKTNEPLLNAQGNPLTFEDRHDRWFQKAESWLDENTDHATRNAFGDVTPGILQPVLRDKSKEEQEFARRFTLFYAQREFLNELLDSRFSPLV
jgi:hypothetical protein